MWNSVLWCFLGICCLFTTVTGSEIVLETSSVTIIPPLTRYLKLRCSLNDTTTSSAIVGRDVTSTSYDVHHVSSLVVMKSDGTHVASISSFSGATAHIDNANLNVTGDVTSSPGERAFIELIWEYPTENQSDVYKCEVNGMSDQGHNVVFSQAVEIASSDPTTADLVRYIHDNQLKTDQLEKERDDMKMAIELQKHIERGQLRCGDSNTWSEIDGDYKARSLSQQFSKAYDKTPIVYLSVYLYDDDHLHNARYYVAVTAVDEKGFTMKCRKWADSHIYKIYVDWISFPV